MRPAILRIEIVPSPDTDDHAVRLLVDEVDVLAQHRAIGLDPDDFFVPTPALEAAAAPISRPIGRCTCGVRGCGDIEAVIGTDGADVVWDIGAMAYRFDARAYGAELERARLDRTWETPDRTAARLVREGLGPLRRRLDEHGLRFDWASGRVEPGRFTVSLSRREPYAQVLIHVDWSGEAPAAIAAAMLERLATARLD
jgi:hypothetical protein